MKARAVIAEDEPLLAESLRSELAALWPELEVVAIAGDGEAAVNEALARRPDVVFLDIRMPGMSGLEAAEALAEDWPDGAAFPLLVFVTAYDQYALQAFERAAVDYVLKPVQPARLHATVQRLQAALAARGRRGAGERARRHGRAAARPARRAPSAAGRGDAMRRAEPLRVIQVGVGNAIHMVPIDEVLYFEAADKYVRVVTAAREHLIRTSLARAAAAPRRQPLLADPSRHGRSRRERSPRPSATRAATSRLQPAGPARQARRQPPLRASLQGHVGRSQETPMDSPDSAADDERLLERRARRRVGMKMGFYIHAARLRARQPGPVRAQRLHRRSRSWAIFPMLGWGLGLAIHGIVTFASLQGDGLRDRMLESEMERLRRRPLSGGRTRLDRGD